MDAVRGEMAVHMQGVVAGVALAEQRDAGVGGAVVPELAEGRVHAATRLRVADSRGREQRIERDLALHGAERARRFGLHAPEPVVEHGVLEGVGGFLRAELGEFFRGIDAGASLPERLRHARRDVEREDDVDALALRLGRRGPHTT